MVGEPTDPDGHGRRRPRRAIMTAMTDTTTDDTAASNRARVQEFWATLYARDWDGIASFFTADSEYTDVPSPADDVARGPQQVVARLRLGLGKISGYEHSLGLMVAEGGTVVTEHAETWRWHTGEEVTLPFVSVQELVDGSIVRWWDYWDLSTLMNAAPVWWIEDIAKGYL
jgi:limonene-1,2-epoxide hydrolase